MSRVAFQGERGAFSEEAARRLAGPAIRPMPCATFSEMFRAVRSGRAGACLCPIENTLAGSVHENYDLLLEHRLRIQGEVVLRVVHCLIAPPGVERRAIRRVFSHPVALAQCAEFFRRSPGVEKIPYYDTAGAVRMLMREGLRDAAAIAGRSAAEAYGAKVLEEHLEDHRSNFTRFLLLKKSAAIPPGADKTSIVFSTRNVPGALFKTLGVFALRDINLTKIESRPLKGRVWEYLFYVDFLGSPREERCRNALKHLEEVADFVRVLGCYPAAAYPR